MSDENENENVVGVLTVGQDHLPDKRVNSP